MSDQLNGDLFPSSPPTKPRPKLTSSPAMIVSIISTTAAVLLALYIVTPKPTEHTSAESSSSAVQASSKHAPPVQPAALTSATSATATSTGLAQPELHLSATGGSSNYDWIITRAQLMANIPTVSCSGEQDGGHTCILDTEDQLNKACGFDHCREEMIRFDNEDRFSGVSASVDEEVWDQWIGVVRRLGTLKPHTKNIATMSITNKLTCYQLDEGTLTFSHTSGSDVQGNPVRNPYSISYASLEECRPT